MDFLRVFVYHVCFYVRLKSVCRPGFNNYHWIYILTIILCHNLFIKWLILKQIITMQCSCQYESPQSVIISPATFIGNDDKMVEDRYYLRVGLA